MDISHNVDGWIAIALLLIAGAGKVVQALTALAQQVKTLFETIKSIDARVTSHDSHWAALGVTVPINQTPTVTISTGAGQTPTQTGDAGNV